MKHLPKHLRPRWRYVAIGLESWPETVIDRRMFQRELWFAAQNLLGDTGSAAIDARLLQFWFETGEGEAIVRTRRGQVSNLRAVMATIATINEQPLGVFVRGTSGTVRACEEKYIRGPRKHSEERYVAFAKAERTAVVRGDRFDVHLPDGFVGATALDISEI